MSDERPRPERTAGRGGGNAPVAGAVAGVLALLGGVLVGVVGCFQHTRELGPLPLGLLLGLLAVFAVVVAGGVLVAGRVGAALALLGWLVPTVVLSLSGPGSDVVLPADGLGYGWLLGGALAAGLALVPDHAALARRLGIAPP